MAFECDPNTLYSLSDLEQALDGVVGLSTFLENLGLRQRRVFRDAVWGWEILEAARKAPPFAERREPPRPAAGAPRRQRKPGREQKDSPIGRLTAADLG